MAKRINFTKRALEALPLPPRGRRAVYIDVKTAGLQVRVTSSGVKTFSLYRRVKSGAPERVTIGRFGKHGDCTVEQARARAAQINAAIADEKNPAAVRRALAGEPTFGEVFADYLERHAKPRKRTWQEDVAKYDRYLERPLGAKKLSAIERSNIAGIHAAITRAGHPVTANRVLALVSSVFGRAMRWGLAEANPARGIERNPERDRERFLLPAELPYFFEALAAEENDTIRDYFTLSLLTGARRSNVLAMRWRELDLARAEWRLGRTKNGTPQLLPLVAEAVEILRERKTAVRGEFVFPGPGRRGHLVEPKKAWQRALERAELCRLVEMMAEAQAWDQREVARRKAAKPAVTALADSRKEAARLGLDPAAAQMSDLRIHDLRRSLGSWQARTGASLAIIGKSLHHRNVSTTAIYARLDLDPVRESVERATSAMLAAARVKPAADVTPAKKRAA